MGLLQIRVVSREREVNMPFEKVEFQFPDPDKEDVKSSTTPNEDANNTKPESKKEPVSESVEIEIVDDTPPKDRNRKPSTPPDEVTDDELGEYSDKVQKRIKHLSKGYHDERRKAESALREREEAIKLAQKLLEENNTLKESVNKNQEALIEQAKIRAKVELEQAKQEYKRAYESGDSEKVVAAQEALTAAKIKSERVAVLKPPPLQKQETTVQLSNTDPEPSVDSKAVDWQKTNDWFGTDDEMTSFALGVHQKLVKEGIDTRSDEYYEKINSRMREVFPDRFVDTGEEKPAAKPRKSNVVAPVSRSTAPTKIVLTESAVKLAKRLGLTPEQYARQVAIDMRKQNG
jgi:hypothetical protein